MARMISVMTLAVQVGRRAFLREISVLSVVISGQLFDFCFVLPNKNAPRERRFIFGVRSLIFPFLLVVEANGGPSENPSSTSVRTSTRYRKGKIKDLTPNELDKERAPHPGPPPHARAHPEISRRATV